MWTVGNANTTKGELTMSKHKFDPKKNQPPPPPAKLFTPEEAKAVLLESQKKRLSDCNAELVPLLAKYGLRLVIKHEIALEPIK